MSRKTTSLDRLLIALNEHGWEFTTADAEVMVPDETVDYASRWSSRRRLGRKQVTGVCVSFTNNVDPEHRHDTSATSGRAYFTQAGAYLAEHTRGDYPLTKGVALTEMLAIIKNRSAEAVAERRAQRAARQAQDYADRLAAREATLAEAEADLAVRRSEAVELLSEVFDVDTDTAERALDRIHNDGRLTAYDYAHESAQRARQSVADLRESIAAEKRLRSA